MALRKDLAVTLRALTHTTEQAARRHGVRDYLPALTVDRFTNMGGIDVEVFTAQMDGCRSFEDAAWAGYWRGLADAHLSVADAALARLGAPPTARLLGPPSAQLVQDLATALSPAAPLFADRTRVTAGQRLTEFCAEHPLEADAGVAVDALVKALTYLFTAAWPGWTPQRLAAYQDSQRMFAILLRALGPALSLDVEEFTIPNGKDPVSGIALFPSGVERSAVVLSTNGLEGTIAEITLPALKHRPADLAYVAMEMPGTFGYREPMNVQSAEHYRAVIDFLAEHPRVDAARIGMMGMSFGAHWATRMAWRDGRIKAAVANGGLYHRAFQMAGSLGMPEIMIFTLLQTTGATNLIDLSTRMRALSLRDRFQEMTTPVLVLNGAEDTLVPTQDSVDLAMNAPGAFLKLYPNDDHCAMAHYDAATSLSLTWLRDQLNA